MLVRLELVLWYDYVILIFTLHIYLSGEAKGMTADSVVLADTKLQEL